MDLEKSLYRQWEESFTSEDLAFVIPYAEFEAPVIIEKNEKKLHTLRLKGKQGDEVVVSYKSLKDREYMNDLILTVQEGLRGEKDNA